MSFPGHPSIFQDDRINDVSALHATHRTAPVIPLIIEQINIVIINEKAPATIADTQVCSVISKVAGDVEVRIVQLCFMKLIGQLPRHDDPLS